MPASQARYWNQKRETRDWSQRRQDLDRRFRQAFRHALEHSPAYQELYRQAGIDPREIHGLDDLPRLPLLRMDQLRQRQKEHPPFGGFETVPPHEVRRIYVNPGRIFQPGEWEYRDTSWTEGLCAAGFRPGDRVLNAFNYHLWPYAFMLDESVKMVGATVVPSGVGNTLMQVKLLKELRINAFLGTPSFLMTLVQRAEGLGLDPKQDLYLERAMVGAEMLPESLREQLQDMLGMSIRQAYGTVLLGCLGYECHLMSGLHVPDNVIVELVDPASGQPVKTGSVGEIVATNLNPVYPMIRLATGDLSILSHQSCGCGRTGPMLRRVLGRADQATKVRGTFIHPWQTDEFMAHYPEVFKYQVVITRKDHSDQLTLLAEPADESVDAGRLAARIERDIREFLGLRGQVKVVPRGSIPDFHQKIEDKRKWD